MKNWLAKLAQQEVEHQGLQDAIDSLSPDDLNDLAVETGVAETAPETSAFQERMTQADRMGRELAQIHGGQLAKQAQFRLEKTAILPALAG